MSALACASLAAGASLPLLREAHHGRAIAFDGSRRIDAAQFLAEVRAVAAALPAQRHALNLCEDRYAFLVAFCAVALRGQVNLLPHARAPDVVTEMLERYPDSYCLGEQRLDPEPPRFLHLCGHSLRSVLPGDWGLGAAIEVPELLVNAAVAIGFTSGSTGQPRANRKTWRSFCASTARNAALLQQLSGGRADLVATVPPQHMYGMELSVLLPLLSDMAVHTARPFFPAEIAQALEQAHAPRLLVTTPVHLRALLECDIPLPPLAGIVTATAPLDADLARRAEARHGAPVQEMFGSTETCVIAHRRTARDTAWTCYADVRIAPQPDGSQVDAPWYEAPVLLQDVLELLPGGRFELRGRNSDLIEIAGKRASLGELTQRLLALPGVQDAVVFQAEDCSVGTTVGSDAGNSAGTAAGTGASNAIGGGIASGVGSGNASSAESGAESGIASGAGSGARKGAGIRRIAALAVAPGMDAGALLQALRRSVDPVFLPRPLRLVDALPRNATGKLAHAALQEMLRGTHDDC